MRTYAVDLWGFSVLVLFHLIEIIEKCLLIIEFTGFKTDVSIGKVEVEFTKHRDKILIRDE